MSTPVQMGPPPGSHVAPLREAPFTRAHWVPTGPSWPDRWAAERHGLGAGVPIRTASEMDW
eukprot:8833500-Alexandrium_andersonii.AAC.1